MRWLGSYLGHPATLADLSRQTILAWMAWGKASRSPRTVNNWRASVLSLWRYSRHELHVGPKVQRVPKLRVPQRIPTAWTLEEFSSIIAACRHLPGDWLGCPVSLAWEILTGMLWDTGSRLRPALLAGVADVDLLTGSWFMPAEHLKGGRADRLFRLHPDTVSLIRASLVVPRARLFPFPFVRPTIWDHWRRILRLAGLPTGRQWGFHCIRRTAESYAAQKRGIEFAAACVGHGVEVARASYVSPRIAVPPALIDVLPRPVCQPRLRAV